MLIDELQAHIRAFCEQNADPALVAKYQRYFVEGYDAFGVDGKKMEQQRAVWLEHYRNQLGLAGFLDLGDRLVATGKYEEASFALGFAGAEQELVNYEVSPKPREVGRLANVNPPVLHTHDRFGHREDRIDFHPAYHQLMGIAIAAGLNAAPWADSARHRGARSLPGAPQVTASAPSPAPAPATPAIQSTSGVPRQTNQCIRDLLNLRELVNRLPVGRHHTARRKPTKVSARSAVLGRFAGPPTRCR